MKVLGIDPGTAVLGYGVVENGAGRHHRLVECGTLTTQTCTQWVPQVNVSITPVGGGGGYTVVCGTWVTKIEKISRDP